MSISLLAIDGLNLARRVYEANRAEDSVEKAETAVRSIRQSLKRALQEHRPSHVLVAVDAGGPTWRHLLTPSYKSGRKPMPEPLREALSKLWDHLSHHRWHVVARVGVEADDVLSSAAVQAQEAAVPCTVLSTDKDLLFLLSHGAKVYNHFERSWRDAAWCESKMGIRPEQVLDWLALKGDPVDGIEGIVGVGDKTAAALLREHGTLEHVLEQAAANQIGGKLGLKLKEGASVARAARRLTALKTNCFVDGLPWHRLNQFDVRAL